MAGRPSNHRTYLTGKELVADVMEGRVLIVITSIPQMVEEKHGTTLSLNSIRVYLSQLAGEGVLYYAAQGVVSNRIAAGATWLPPTEPVSKRQNKLRPNLPVQYALLKAAYLLGTPAGARIIRGAINLHGEHLVVPPLASAHRNLTVMERAGLLRRTPTGWEVRTEYAKAALAEWKRLVEPTAPDYLSADPLSPELADLLS